MSVSSVGVRGDQPRALPLNKSPKRKRSRIGRLQAPLIFVIPLAVFLIAFVGYPMFQLIRMSFSDVSTATITGSWPLVGLRNFQNLFASPTFGATVLRTAVFGVVVLVVGLIGGLLASLALQKKSRFSAFTYTIIVLMWSLPAIVNGATWKYMLTSGGIVDQVLQGVGLTTQPVYFLVNGSLPLLSVAFVAGWTSLPFAVIVFRSALLEVPKEYYEAAQMDGANRIAQFRYVTFPAIAPTVYVVSILLLSYAVRSFDFTYTMTSGGPGQSSTTLPFLGYQTAFTEFDYSGGAAIAVITIIAVLIFALPYARGTRKRDS